MGQGEVVTNDGDPSDRSNPAQDLWQLLDPTWLIPEVEFSEVEETEKAGRRGFRISATPRAGNQSVPMHSFFGSDEIALTIDAERGVILERVDFFEGAVLSLEDVIEVGFDEELDPQIFVFTAPAGAKIRSTKDVQRGIPRKMRRRLFPRRKRLWAITKRLGP